MSSLRLPWSLGSPAAARRHLYNELAGWASDGSVDAAVLLVSELVTNAVVHGHPELLLTVKVTDSLLRVEVIDGSPHLPVRRRSATLTNTGRGILLLDRLADRWGVDRSTHHGKMVWFELDARQPLGEKDP